jgi:xylan 1,4-beta-xylosidase
VEGTPLNRRTFVRSAAMFTGASALGVLPQNAGAQQPPDSDLQTATVRPHVVTRTIPHAWEECIGSDRASVGLRAQWLSDLERVKKQTGVKSVRFHGLFNDEMGVWPPGAKTPNFLYVDMVFDAMIERGVKPFVELSFMPGALASGNRTVFFYHGNITLPKEMKQWAELVRAFGDHCVQRYGIAEVSTWSFEVWNEPNLPYFWAGTKDEYFELYRQAATALKGVDPKLRAGGPSTARAAWVGDLLEFCAAQQVPIDFVSTHIYPDDPQDIVFGPGIHYPFEEVIPRALTKLKGQISSSRLPQLPLYITEWSSQNPAFIAHTVKGSVGLAEIMSFWTFDNVYEELGIPKTFMNSGFGLLGMRGVPRPSFHTFALLHRLGESEVSTTDGPILATRRNDGSLAIMLWNLIPQPPGQRSATGDPTVQTSAQYGTRGTDRRFLLKFEGSSKSLRGQITRVDESSGSLRKAYEAIGSPPYPTVQQIEELKSRSELAKPEHVHIDGDGHISLSVPPNGVALIELS